MVAYPKKIAFVGPMFPYRGGIAQFTETMYRGLAARGYNVEGVTFTRQYPALLFPGKTQYEVGSSVETFTALRLIDTLNPLSWLRAAWHLIKQAPDVVIIPYWMPFFAPAFGTVARLLRWRGTKILAIVHNAIPHERRPGDLLLSQFFLKAVDGCVVLSDAVAQDLQRLGVTASVRQVVHPVYDHFGEAPPQAEARAALKLPPAAPVLLFFGFIRKYKGLHVLLDALPQVAQALPGVRLLVAGEFYDDPSSYHAQIETHGLQEHVCLHAGYIPADDVPTFFAAADVVVQPYVSATQSGVAQIAFHFDKPLIITDVGGLAEVVPHEHAGLVVPPEDPDALAAAIIRYFQQELQARLTDGVREEKKKYSWDRLYEAVEALMKEAPRFDLQVL